LRGEKEVIMTETMFSQVQQAGEQWKKLADEQVARARAVADEMGRLREMGNDQAALFIDEWAKLAKGWVTYTAQLSAEWQKLVLSGGVPAAAPTSKASSK
jgi:hypothetical protein